MSESRAGKLAWLGASARVLSLRRPGLPAPAGTPLSLALLLLGSHALALGVQRAFVDGDAQFIWQGVLQGWAGTLLLAGLAWLTLRHPDQRRVHPSLPALLTCVFGAQLLLGLLTAGLLLALRFSLGPTDDWSELLRWSTWAVPLLWALLALGLLLTRTSRAWRVRAAVLLLLPLALLVPAWWSQPVYWWGKSTETGPEYSGLPLTEEVLSAQPRLLADALAAVAPPRPARINVFGLSYAPYAREDVFMRESAVVAATLRERFGAEGRFVELVANPASLQRLPWATPGTLRASIAHMAARMDRERDLLFLHLSSHGGADGQLAADTWPLQTEPMTPQLLRQWLDEAGVRWRVISISACYAGSWIEPLAGDTTLVMTAADAENTSYGCGRKSPITFFGRAMYEEALRETRDFEAAHALARQRIEQREQEAGKDDGYSNPQLRMGAQIRPVLQRLAQEQR